MWNEAKERWKARNWIRKYLCLVLIAVLVTTQCTQSWGVPQVIAQTACSTHEAYDETCDECSLVIQIGQAEDESDETDGTETTESEAEESETTEPEPEEPETTESEAEESETTESQPEEPEITEPEPEESETTESEAEEPEITETEPEETETTESEPEEPEITETEPEESETTSQQADVTYALASAKAADVSINETTFPDANFRNFVISKIAGGDTILSGDEQTAVTDIDVRNQGISDLTGIHYFTNLRTLDCSNNQLTGWLDLGTEFSQLTTLNLSYNQLEGVLFSGMTSLTDLDISNNWLIGLDTGPCQNLTNFDCSNNRFDVPLNLSGTDFPKLTDFDCSYNQIPNLNISGLSSLTDLDCSNNQLTELPINEMSSLTDLDLSHNQLAGRFEAFDILPDLSTLNLSYNQLEELYCSGMTSLTDLDISNNLLHGLDTGPCPNLTTYNLSNNQFWSSLTVSGTSYPNLTDFDCSNNPLLKILTINGTSLTKLNVSGCIELENLDCSDNQLAGRLDLGTEFSKLKTLNLSHNQLEGVIFSGMTSLTDFDCSNNFLTGLDTNICPELTTFDCSNNQFDVYLNIYGATFPKLTEFDCSDNPLQNLYVNGMTSLTTLDCSNNRLTELAINEMPSLTILNCSGNQLTGTLDVRVLTSLTTLNCSGNQLSVIDATGCALLQELDISSNQMYGSELAGCPSLKTLYCQNNLFVGLNYYNIFPNLTTIDCSNNRLTSLGVNECISLKNLNCSNNQLTFLEISGLNLEEFNGTGQKPESLTMILEGTKWIDQSDQKYVPGKDVTKFYGDEKMESEPLKFSVEDDGTVTATPVLTLEDSIYFKSQLKDAAGTKTHILSGKVSYTASGTLTLKAEICYMDKSTAKELEDDKIDQLAQYFTIKINDSEAKEDMAFTVVCDDFADVQTGTIKSYPVTISYGDFSVATTLEVGLDINETNFKDVNFQSYISTYYDTGKEGSDNGFLTADELAAVDSIVVSGQGISDLTGIQYFTNLETLDCSNNQLSGRFTAENIFPKLTTLNLSENQLEVVKLSGTTLLTELNISSNLIYSLETGTCPNLTTLNCSNNRLTELDVSEMPSLTDVDCSINQLTAFDEEGILTNLQKLRCSTNPLGSLNLSKYSQLSILYCSSNQLTELDVSSNTALTELGCDFNQLKELNVSHLEHLQELSCENNQLTNLNIGALKELTSVKAYGQTVIDVLPMVYEGTQWVNKKMGDSDVVRTFSTGGTQFSAKDGTKLESFGIIGEGTLTAKTVLPVQDINFVSNLVDGNNYSWSKVLTGTFQYEPRYDFNANNAIYNSAEVKQALEEEADLKNLPGLLYPNTDEFIAEATASLESGDMDELQNGTVGSYTYQATLFGNSYTGRKIHVVSADSVVNEARDAYIHAEDFFIGMSSLTDGLEATVIQKSSAIYKELDEAGDLVQPEDWNNFSVKDLENIGTVAGTYEITIIHNISQLQIKVQVTVLNDAASSLVFIPANIELTRVGEQKNARAESYVELVENAEKIIEGTVKVYTDASITLSAQEDDADDQILVDVYTEAGERPGESVPLATLDATDLQDTFKLISSDITNLQGITYEGTMKFKIKYEESDGNEL